MTTVIPAISTALGIWVRTMTPMSVAQAGSRAAMVA